MFFFTCFSLSSCSEAKKKIPSEDFIIFLSDFSSIPDFQKKRLSADLIECEINTDGDSICEKSERQSWKYINLEIGGSVKRIYDNFQLKTDDTDERVFSIERIEGGSSTYYFFRRYKGQWFLIKRVIYL